MKYIICSQIYENVLKNYPKVKNFKYNVENDEIEIDTIQELEELIKTLERNVLITDHENDIAYIEIQDE